MNEIRVAVVGAGMAGLTAALRLAERGYVVDVYEERGFIGGQFSAHTHDPDPGPESLYYEHSYHMLLGWYHNFWQVVEDIGLEREWDFEPRTAVRHLARGAFHDWLVHGGAEGPTSLPRMPALVCPGSPKHAWRNLFSGIASPPDMFLYAYSLVDLLSQPLGGARLLDEYTVNGFVQSRLYASERSAELHDHTLAKAFAYPSYLSSAASYQRFIKYGFANPEPMLWVLKGDIQRYFHRHLESKLRGLGCRIHPLHRVTGIVVATGGRDAVPRAAGISYLELVRDEGTRECVAGEFEGITLFEEPLPKDGKPDPAGSATRQEYDYVVVAVPPGALASLKIYDAKGTPISDTDHRILPLRRELFQFVPRLKAQSMASLDLHFTRKVPGIPKEHVVLLDSEFGLSFIDNSQAWPGHPHTVLNVVASDFGSLSHVTPAHAEFLIIKELARYVPFDPYVDLDQTKTHFQTNVGDRLFVNEVGSQRWRPGSQTVLPNLFLAGDYCRTVIDVVTIEGAVTSGLEAARALQSQAISERRLRPGDALARLIPIAEPDAYSEAEMLALKLMLAPHAYVAKALSWLYERTTSATTNEVPSFDPARIDEVPMAGDLLSAGMKFAMMPWAMAAECWRLGWSAWGGMFGPSGPAR